MLINIDDQLLRWKLFILFLVVLYKAEGMLSQPLIIVVLFFSLWSCFLLSIDSLFGIFSFNIISHYANKIS